MAKITKGTTVKLAAEVAALTSWAKEQVVCYAKVDGWSSMMAMRSEIEGPIAFNLSLILNAKFDPTISEPSAEVAEMAAEIIYDAVKAAAPQFGIEY